MDTMEAYRSPPIKPEPRWVGREDVMDRPPPADGYRRRSPGKIICDDANSAIIYPLLLHHSRLFSISKLNTTTRHSQLQDQSH